MKTLDELISHFRCRMTECSREIDELVRRCNRNTTSVTDAEYRKWISDWEDERRICRDTAAYLETLKSNRK